MGDNAHAMVSRLLIALMLTLVIATKASMVCPPTAAWGPACGMKLTATASASCDAVLEEMKARVEGQYGSWHDPHNNGTYKVEAYGGTFSTSRLTGDGKYTDKQIFSLSGNGDSCKVEACSRSQVSSVLDMGTNYCDLKMLLCGSADGCKPVKHDFSLGTETTEKFSQSSVDMSSCLKVAEPETAALGLPEATLKTYFSKEALANQMATGSILVEDSPCCKSCTEPEEMYYSVDVPHGFCGQTCMNPNKFWIYKIFESNLTKANDNTPCPEQFTPHGGHYTNYTSTVTHGVPGLSITLDLYGPVDGN